MDDQTKLTMQSQDLSDLKFAQLQALFPQVFTEAKDEDGNTIRAINTELLEQEINTKVLDGKKERYEFTWPDKRQAIRMANTPTNAALRPCREESVDFDTTENLYIEGDNLEVLKLLRETYLNKVKMIYIDPPYNTGKDFVYRDNFTESVGSFLEKDGQYDELGNRLVTNLESNGRFHTDWLNMMYPRLKIARDLLTDDGVIFISVDDGEIENLKKICHEIFGSTNHIATFVWKNKYGPGAFTRGIASLHEYILCYGKVFPDRIDTELSEEEQIKYKLKDSKYPTRGGFITQPLATLSKDDRPNLVYPLVHEGVEIWPNKQWIWSKDRLSRAYENDEIVIKEKHGKYSVRFKQYLRDENGKMRSGTPLSLITSVFNQDGTKEITNLIGRGVFDFPKPVDLVKKFLSLIINGNEDCDFTILDFFSGSSTTAHAVMQLNAEDGGKRKFIMVQLPEETPENSPARSAGFETISDIGKERIRRAGRKIKEESPITTTDLDVGFRVLKLASSNMKDVFYTPDETLQTDISFDGLVNNIKEDRSDEDLLFQVMLELGIPLSSKIEKKDGVFYVEETYLIACFQAVDNEQIKEIAKKEPYYVVFRDSSFANDSDSINFDQIFATYSPHTKRRVL